MKTITVSQALIEELTETVEAQQTEIARLMAEVKQLEKALAEDLPF